MRLIDADALKDKVNSLIDDSPIEKEDEFWNWAVKSCVEEIDKAPAVFDCRSCKHNGNERECVDCHDYSNFVKYEERLSGKWKKIGEEYYNWSSHNVIKCSLCGYVKDTSHEIFPYFCEQCGADMRGEDNE